MTEDEVAGLVTLAASYWSSFRPDRDVTYDAWLRLLGDIDGSVCLAALDLLCAEGREFAPTPGQVRDRALELTEPAAPSADLAWQEVRLALSRFGRYGRPSFGSPAIADAVRSLGWQSICDGDENVVRAHFLKLYPEIARRHRSAAALPPTSVRLVAELSPLRALPLSTSTPDPQEVETK